MEIRDILSGAKSFHKIYNQVIQTAAARHHLSLMDAACWRNQGYQLPWSR